VDNFLWTDEDVSDRRSVDGLDCDEIGILPKYNVLDASFLTKGDAVGFVLATFAGIKSY